MSNNHFDTVFGIIEVAKTLGCSEKIAKELMKEGIIKSYEAVGHHDTDEYLVSELEIVRDTILFIKGKELEGQRLVLNDFSVELTVQEQFLSDMEEGYRGWTFKSLNVNKKPCIFAYKKGHARLYIGNAPYNRYKKVIDNHEN